MIPLFDPEFWETLSRETAQTDPSMLRDLVKEFQLQMPLHHAAIETALAEVNSEEIRGIAHRLKGSAGMLGLPKVAQCAGDLEAAAKVRNIPVYRSSWEKFCAAFTETFADPAVVALVNNPPS